MKALIFAAALIGQSPAPEVTPSPSPVVSPSPVPSPSPSTTFAGEIASKEQAIDTVEEAIGAFQRKDFAMATSCVIMLLVFGLDMLWLKNQTDTLRAKVLPWLAILIGAVLQFAATLAQTKNWAQALNMAFVTGTSASGLWSLGGKQLIGKLAPKEAAANPDRMTTAEPAPK